MDEKTKDRIRILSYISCIEKPIVSVSDIEKYSGADKLRVFPILYELYLNKTLLPCSYTSWGVPDGYFVRELNLKKGDAIKYGYIDKMNSVEEFQEYI